MINNIEEVNVKEVYEKTTKPYLNNLVNGLNVTVFAYGATGSGKSHTMTGTSAQPGIIPRAISEIFSIIEHTAANENDVFFYVRLSYVELYNNNFRNLLAYVAKDPDVKKNNFVSDPISMSRRGSGLMSQYDSQNDQNEKIEVRECQNTGVFLAGSNLRVPVTTAQEAFQLIAKGNKYRATGATLCNEQSSRSHAIFQINYNCIRTERSSGRKLCTTSKLNLVDLRQYNQIVINELFSRF